MAAADNNVQMTTQNLVLKLPWFSNKGAAKTLEIQQASEGKSQAGEALSFFPRVQFFQYGGMAPSGGGGMRYGRVAMGFLCYPSPEFLFFPRRSRPPQARGVFVSVSGARRTYFPRPNEKNFPRGISDLFLEQT